ncbi:hypothetical protein ACLQ2E_28645 [Streptomyces lavendulocolor]
MANLPPLHPRADRDRPEVFRKEPALYVSDHGRSTRRDGQESRGAVLADST